MKQLRDLIRLFYVLLPLGLLVSCTPSVPKDFTDANDRIEIYPDYSNIIVPYNIAPMNFGIKTKTDQAICKISTSDGENIIVKGTEVTIPGKKWSTLLQRHKGKTLHYDIYLKQDGAWKKYRFENTIADEPIDEYISYRLIEPSYKLYKKISINQRNLTNFREDKIYSSTVKWQCVNCHAYQDYNRTGRMNLHLRGPEGGTIITNNGSVEKVNLKTKELPRGGAYLSWHPQKNLIAYSINQVGQTFHSKDKQKVEVMDSYSDLILYDVDKNEVSYIIKSQDRLETYPTWAPDGKSLYYVAADFEAAPSDEFNLEMINDNYEKMKYNIYRLSFDPDKKVFGEPTLVYDAASIGKSATFPKISPDGKYLLFTMADFGCFHIWHKSADLYLMNLETNEVQKLDRVNSPDVESYHSWSSNGRWFIFSSRREDGSYTRFYLSYFDKKGIAHKPFIVPQKVSGFYKEFFKSYNIPEFMVAPVEYDYRDFAIDGPARDAKFVAK